MADDGNTKTPKPVALQQIAANNDRRATLEALRDRLAAAVDSPESQRDLAALALRFTDVLSQIDQIPNTEKVSRADEIAERRATRRRAGAKNSARTARPG